MHIDLLYSDESCIVVRKPEEISFNFEQDSSAGFFHLLKQWGKQNSFTKLYPVHRLDKVTSGLLIAARSAEAATGIGELFSSHTIEKYYLALSAKKPSKIKGTISGDMSRSRRGSWKLERTRNNPAITQFISFGTGEGIRAFVVKPLSGKTHQIRVALKSLGSPILGDLLYEPQDQTGVDEVIDRTYLHAYALKFSYNGKDIMLIDRPSSGPYWDIISDELWDNNCANPWDIQWPRISGKPLSR